MTATNMCSNFGGKWDRLSHLPPKFEHQTTTEAEEDVLQCGGKIEGQEGDQSMLKLCYIDNTEVCFF